ncbi:MAG: hypothetical protein ABI085_22780 [Gemmatimonadaceae bacterium]
MSNEHAELGRAVGVILGGLAVALVLRLAVWRAPALRPLTGPLYWIVAAGVAYGVWYVTRQRAARDRRHSDRRA